MNLKKSRGLLCERVELRYDFIRQEKKAYPVTVLCKVMEVSRSGFYEYFHSFNKKPDKSSGKAVLKARVGAIFKEHRSKYGSRRIAKKLKDEDYQIGRYKVRRLIKKQLTLDALAMAYWRRKPPSGLLHYSDRVSQYACHDYQKRLNQYGMVASMSRKGNC
ncbi:MAG: hypothetical protein EHM49_02535 [Deltaproteobacteria bacterium]|nr:MAG: hypothetical protein EHM49_02535 [Deltaproteobacteria bacterium]